jgi:methylated-DNA-protein-cysteine methyltransferase-like protein
MKNLSPLFIRTIKIIKNIPKGKVATYSSISNLIGAPGCARHVSYILSSSSDKYNLPWHRVVNSKGKISLAVDQGYFTQKKKLMSENVIFQNDAISLPKYLWRPSEKKISKMLKGLPQHIPIKAR